MYETIWQPALILHWPPPIFKGEWGWGGGGGVVEWGGVGKGGSRGLSWIIAISNDI